MLDIYTKKAIVTPSDEHIVLDAFGGRWASRDLIDKATNDALGHGIDAGIADDFQFIRVLLDAKSGDGRSPPPLKGATDANGSAYHLTSGGIPEMAKPEVSVTKLPDGQTAVSYSVRSMGELHRLSARIAKRAGLSRDDIEANATRHESNVPPLKVPSHFGPGTWRATTKMACNLLAAVDRELFLDEAFDEVRNFVLTGGYQWDFVAINTQPVDVTSAPGALGPLDHVLLVRSDAAGLVRGLVILYGHFQVCVRLGSLTTPRAFAASYRVDQVGRVDRINAPADLDLTIPPIIPLQDSTRKDWYETLHVGINRILRIAEQHMDRAALSQMVTNSMRDAFGPPGRQRDTPENRREFHRLLMIRVREFVGRNGLTDSGAEGFEASLSEILGERVAEDDGS